MTFTPPWRAISVAAFAAAGSLATGAAQAQEYLDTVAKASCQCVEKIAPGQNANSYRMKIGLCIVEAALPYKDAFKRDLNLDFSNSKDAQTLGSTIGQHMVLHCPQAVVSVSERAALPPGSEEQSAEGTITKIEKLPFVSFTLLDAAGKSIKLLWLEAPTSSIDLVGGYASLNGRRLKFSYQAKDLFDPTVNDYRKFNVITRVW